MNSNCPTVFRKFVPSICPFPGCLSQSPGPNQRSPVRCGFFFRKDDSRWIQRFQCRTCKRTFSRASFHPARNQKRRRLNQQIQNLYPSLISHRRLAWHLGITRPTVARKLVFLGYQALRELENAPRSVTPEAQFDELETYEHTKKKPLSVPIAVDGKTRRILAFQVCSMPAKGLLAPSAFQKYGPRKDERPQALDLLLLQLRERTQGLKIVRSDSNPNYPTRVERLLPGVRHLQEKGRASRADGQGELKKGGFDPLFSLNHTCAQLRANINRLIRRTWCTTKRADRLTLHLALYAQFHNRLIDAQLSTA